MAPNWGQWLRQGVGVFFEYDTPKIVHIKSKRIGVLSRLVQLSILAYVIGFVLVYKKGYQTKDDVISAVTAKVKGVIRTNFTDEELDGVPQNLKHLYRRVWDVTDFVVPPVENNAFFVTTNLIITPNQTRSICPESPSVKSAVCTSDKDCEQGGTSVLSHGVNTGACVPYNSSVSTCQIQAWCPVELDQPPSSHKAVLEDSRHFTVLLKNQIKFPLFDKRRTNILKTQNKSYLSECLYDADTDPFCPVFKLETIVTSAGENYSMIAMTGGVISVGITWDCDLDYDFYSYCRPVYNFRRLDDPDSPIAPGWNFRHSSYFGENERTLYKAYGINFVVNVWGSAGKFDFIPTLMNLGSGLALLGLTTVICDIIVLYLMKNGFYYKEKKYLEVKGSDAFNVYRSFENPSTAEERSPPSSQNEQQQNHNRLSEDD